MALKVESVLCRPGEMDNYAYIAIDGATGAAAVIDPSDYGPIAARLAELGAKPSVVINTHHHHDHTDGNWEMKKLRNCEVWSTTPRAAGTTRLLADGEEIAIGESKGRVILAPGHTMESALLYFPEDKILFTGDVLFNLCIGGLFEGTRRDMERSLDKIRALPDDVMFYPGHEYTLHAMDYALGRHNSKDKAEVAAYLERGRARLRQGKPVHPVSLGYEKKCNPYL